MASRRIACFLVGMWLAGGLLLFWFGRESAYRADRMIDEVNPNVALGVKLLGHEDARLLFRHVAAEEYRRERETWEMAQLLLGALFFFFLLFGTREGKLSLGLGLLLVGIVLVQRFLLTPEVSALGRLTDFVPLSVHSGNRIRLKVLSAGYVAFELGKWSIQVILTGLLLSHRRKLSGDFEKSAFTTPQAGFRSGR